MDVKQCGQCKRHRSVDKFGKNRRSKDGLHPLCRECRRAYSAAHKDERNAYDRAWRQLHGVEKAAYDRAYCATHREEIAAHQRKYEAMRPARPEQQYAHRAVKAAVKAGRLARPQECSLCGCAHPVNAHHEDYSRPLEVVWLCQSCHLRLHAGYFCLLPREWTA